MRTSTRTVGTLFTAAAIALSVAPAAGAATITPTEQTAVVPAAVAQAPASIAIAQAPDGFALNTAAADWYHPCWHRWFRIQHPYRCGVYGDGYGYYGGGYHRHHWYPHNWYYGGHRHFRRF